MKDYFKNALVVTLATVTLFSACKKTNEREVILEREIAGTKGVYVLCEGGMGGDAGVISYYDVEKKTTIKDYYKQVNGKALGETANDLQAYGSKMYCVISGKQGSAESFIDVMSVSTGKTIKRIPFNTTNDGYLPRNITFYKNKAYVTRLDGKISRIDTASLDVDAELQLKNGVDNIAGLEGLAVANGKLYVAGSDHYLYANSLKNKVVVIDLNTFTQTKDITVNHNPQKIAVTATGDLFVTSWGNYSNIQPALQKISSVTDLVTQTESSTDIGAITIVNNKAFVAKDIYTAPSIKMLNIATGKIGNDFVSDGTAISLAYGLTINPFDNSVVVSDSGTSKAFVFSQDGKIKYSFATGSFPQVAVFNYSYKYLYKTL